MYPDSVPSDPISLELYCCNSINECEVNAFLVSVYDTDPELDTTALQSAFILEYDSSASVGATFTWSTNQLFLSDPDVVSDSANDPYDHQTHSVSVTMTSTNTGFSAVNT